jgi:hypothetical protein
LPDVVVEAGAADFFDEDVVGEAQDVEFFARDGAGDADGGAGERVAVRVSGYTRTREKDIGYSG